MDKPKKKQKQALPAFFERLFWSYNFSLLDLDRNKKTIILNSINYGGLKHWRWINNHYGKGVIKEILGSVPATELKKRAGRLAEILFEIKLNYAPRGTYQRRG